MIALNARITVILVYFVCRNVFLTENTRTLIEKSMKFLLIAQCELYIVYQNNPLTQGNFVSVFLHPLKFGTLLIM